MPHIPDDGMSAAACSVQWLAGEVKVEVKESMDEVDFSKIALPEAFEILQASAHSWADSNCMLHHMRFANHYDSMFVTWNW